MLVRENKRIAERWSPTGRRETVQDYYICRHAPSRSHDYWLPALDPDGRLRDRICERERIEYLTTIESELAFISSLEPSGLVVDFGCGPGWFLEELSGSPCLGVEVSVVAQHELDRRRIPWVSDTGQIADSAADVVLCHHVIEHLVDPISCIVELRRILIPGGWLVIGTPDFNSPCARRFGQGYRMLCDSTHRSLFTLESMHRFLRDHGFVIDRVEFPFPAKYATAETFLRWNDTANISPPWPGNWMTFYCQRSRGG